MEIQIIDKKTGKEPSERVVMNIAKKQGLMTMDIDQFAVCEDGQIILLDDCGKVAYCNMNRFMATSRWISCKEKLPEYDGYYLVTYEKEFVPDHVDEVNHYKTVGVLYYSKRHRWICIPDDMVYAWQPLPEPYKGEGDDK